MGKAYGNSVIAEVSQQLYGGLLRCVSLGPTEGLSTWSCGVKFIFQPVVVPVGKLGLGRIFNVLGTSVDLYENLPQSAPYRIESLFELKQNANPDNSRAASEKGEATLDFIESIGFYPDHHPITASEQRRFLRRVYNKINIRTVCPADSNIYDESSSNIASIITDSNFSWLEELDDTSHNTHHDMPFCSTHIKILIVYSLLYGVTLTTPPERDASLTAISEASYRLLNLPLSDFDSSIEELKNNVVDCNSISSEPLVRALSNAFYNANSLE